MSTSGGTVPIDPLNPEFDEGMTGWEPRPPAAGVTASSWQVVNDPDTAHSGDNYLLWEGDSVDYAHGGYFNVEIAQGQVFVPPSSGSVDVSIWLRATRTSMDYLASARVYYESYDSNGRLLSTVGGWGVTSLGGTLDTGWVEHSDIVPMREGAVYMKYVIVVFGGPGSKVMIDSLSWNACDPSSMNPPENVPVITIPNSSFETGDLTSWDQNGGWYVSSTETGAYDGVYEAVHRDEGDWFLVNQNRVAVVPGTPIRASCWLSPSRGSDRGSVIIAWYDASGNPLGAPYTWGTPTYSWGTNVQGTGNYRQSTINTTVPLNARFMAIGVHIKQYTRSYFGVDKFEWDYVYDRTVSLSSPQSGKTIQVGSSLDFTVNVGGTSPPIEYLRLLRNGAVVHEFSSPPYTYTLLNSPIGEFVFTAEAGLPGGGVITSNSVIINVQEEAVVTTERREYNASNAFTYMIAKNFSGIQQAIPDTSRIVGIRALVDYRVDVLARTKDLNLTDPSSSNPNVVFNVVPSGALEAVLLDSSDGNYTKRGNSAYSSIVFDPLDYTITEESITTDGRKWTVMEGENIQVEFGGEDYLFGLEELTAQGIMDQALGFRFTIQAGHKPEFTGAGDAVFRVKINSIKFMVYFDSGSPIYYFASPDKSEVLKGTLVSSYVLDGGFRTGDAQGVMQLLPELEQMDGTQRYIGSDWTIHAEYPPEDRNKIGDVIERELGGGYGMTYNALPTQFDIVDNRSRYLFITTNFYGDKDWDSMYGVNGVDRAFAYNGEYFYNIYTQANLEKDRPRHVANHHLHLALGYDQGRVDISVAGQPYNFNGAEGASTWAIGDQVVGLLPLSGMILGIFGNKSVHGLAGTTVDNFTTQVISAKRGAIEYTIADMGYPVYANSYGIYTLSQIQQYGDYAGTPMSDPVSPWFKDRLLRKNTSSKEVVCAWPVRTSNQYRLAFRDGYVVSMTMDDTKGYPTFSFLKYFITPPNEYPDLGLPLTEYPTIYPIAVSSELDDTGEERIHIANIEYVKPPPPPSLEIGVALMYSNTYSPLFNLNWDPRLGGENV